MEPRPRDERNTWWLVRLTPAPALTRNPLNTNKRKNSCVCKTRSCKQKLFSCHTSKTSLKLLSQPRFLHLSENTVMCTSIFFFFYVSVWRSVFKCFYFLLPENSIKTFWKVKTNFLKMWVNFKQISKQLVKTENVNEIIRVFVCFN